MTEQEKQEKVIKGLECAIDPDHFGFKNCHDCFYRKDVDHLQYVCDGDRCISDALALLKAQEPRVMTLEEVEEGKPYWLEMRRIASEYAICKLNDNGDSAFLDFAVQFGWKTLESDGYGKTWRCWTSRPTDEQREAVKWE